MLKQLSYKQQFYLFTIGFIVILFFIYGIAIKPTISLKRDCNKKGEAVEALSSAPQRIKVTTKRLNQINSQFTSFSTTGSASRDLILDEISAYCSRNGLTVFNYPESHFSQSNLFEVETNKMVVKGSFKGLVKLISHLEKRANFGRIVAVNFYTEENRKTKRKVLFLELYIQNIRNDETSI